MITAKFVQVAAVTGIAATLLTVAVAHHPQPNGSTPVVFSVLPVPAPGAKVLIEVDLDQLSTHDQIVAISTQTPGNWESLPTTITVRAGQLAGFASARIAPNGYGLINGSASCNGSSVSMNCLIFTGKR